MTSLIQPPAPAWIRVVFIDYLSTVPLRVNGVRNVVDFVAYSSTKQPSLTEQSPETSTHGPLLTADALTQVSKLLCFPPSTLSADTYFCALAVQLHSLLDGDEGPDMAGAAGYIIGSGILGRKSFGAPGAVGWRVFAKPLLDIINPSTHIMSIESVAKSEQDSILYSPLSSEANLSLALQRLLAIVEAAPNQGLRRRLLSSLFVSLWGLHNYATQRCPNTIWSITTWNLLEIYSSGCASTEQLIYVSSNLLWDGPSAWTYGPGSLGGIEIRRRPFQNHLANDPTNMIEKMGSLDQRATTLAKLLDVTVDDATIGKVFLDISRRWLLPRSFQKTHHILDEDSKDPLYTLISARLVKAMLEKLQHRLSKNYEHVLQLVKQILGEYIHAQKDKLHECKDQNQPSYRSLGQIARANITSRTSVNLPEDDGSTEVVTISLSLLDAILNTIDGPLSIPISDVLVSLKTDLAFLNQASSIPTSVSSTAKDLLSLISLLVLPPLGSTTPALDVPQHDLLSRDRLTHQSTLTSLTDSHPAIRAEGLHHLGRLISTNSPVINPLTTTHLLLSMLRDQEEYVYLSAIRTLVTLVAQTPRAVLRALLDAYADRGEDRGLDERLRIGEAIGKCMETFARDSTVALSGDAPRSIAEAMIGVAGRRGRRAKEAHDRTRQRQQAERDAKQAWGGEVPVLGDLLSQEDSASTPQDMADDALAEILQGWQGTGEEEDVRIRASAVTLLGEVVGLCAADLDDALLVAAWDLAMSILELERGDGKAILRRAAVVCIMGLVNALDAVWCQGKGMGNGKGKGKGLESVAGRLEAARSLLRYVRDVDADDLVREQAAVVLGDMEEWRMKVVQGMFARERERDGIGLRPALGSAGIVLAGLDVIPDIGADDGRGERRVMVEEMDD